MGAPWPDSAGQPCVANLGLGGGRSPAVEATVAAGADAGVVMVVAAGSNGAEAALTYCSTTSLTLPRP